MEEKGTNKITFVEFLDLIQPSFAAIDSKEDMDAILARTHVVLLGEHGVYWRVASIEKKEVNFEPWPKDENKDLLAEDQVPIFKAYKANPTNHQLPPNFHEDSVWSQEVLRRLVAGESIPKIVTHVRHTGMFGQEVPARQVAPAVMPATEAKAKVKQEKVNYVWRFLKRAGPLQIELDSPSPSPAKRSRSSNEPSHAADIPPSSPFNPSLPGLPQMEEDQVEDDFMPAVGEDVLEDEDVVVEEAYQAYQGGTTNDSIPTLPQDVCGVLVLQWFGLPVSCDKSGPFSVGDLNQMLAPFHVRLTRCCPKTLAVDGKYLCHAQNHFTGLHATEGYFQHFDNGKVEVWNIGQVARLADSSEVTFFHLKPVNGVSSEVCGLAEIVGGSNGKYVCPLRACVRDGCCGTLLRHHVVDATLYGLAGPRKCRL